MNFGLQNWFDLSQKLSVPAFHARFRNGYWQAYHRRFTLLVSERFKSLICKFSVLCVSSGGESVGVLCTDGMATPAFFV